MKKQLFTLLLTALFFTCYALKAQTPQTIDNFYDINKVYGDPDFLLTATSSSGYPVTYSSSNSEIASISEDLVTIHRAGIVTITATQAGDSEYESVSLSKTLTISPATLFITADDKERYTGEVNPEFTISYSGFVNGENADVLECTPTATSTATVSSPEGMYPIVVADCGIENSNYSYSFVQGTLKVFKAPVTGHGLFFNNAERDRLVVNASALFDLGTQDFTIYANIIADPYATEDHAILSNRYGGTEGLRFGIKNRKLYLKIADNDYIVNTTGPVVANGACLSVVVKRTAGTIEFFVDGTSAGTYTYPLKTINSASQYWIGNDVIAPITGAFSGFINEVGYWNTALSNAAISALSPETTTGNESGLIALWKMNEASGQYAYDASPNGITARLGTSQNVNTTDPAWTSEECTDPVILKNVWSADEAVNSNLENAVLLSPNPATQSTSLVMQEFLSGTLLIYNTSGMLVKTIETYSTGENIAIDNSLPAGIYHVVFKSDEGVYSSRLNVVR